jgi:hypothetical protein
MNSVTLSPSGFNTLYFEINCPACGGIIRSGIGFRAGSIARYNYHLGEAIKWTGPNPRPSTRPPNGNLKTIGYFNCDNPRCETWGDCFPSVQEALIVIENDVIKDAQMIRYKPDEQTFDIIDPPGLN